MEVEKGLSDLARFKRKGKIGIFYKRNISSRPSNSREIISIVIFIKIYLFALLCKPIAIVSYNLLPILSLNFNIQVVSKYLNSSMKFL